MRLLSPINEDLDLITDTAAKSVKGFRDIREYGAVPNDPSKAAENDAAFSAAVTGGGRVYVPAGTWWVSDEIMLPTDTFLYGDGVGKTTIKAVDGYPTRKNVITNAYNDRLSRTTYNTGIHISDLTVDGNAANRVDGGPTGGSGGCCIALSTVRDCLIERVRATGGYWNNIDIAASVYSTAGTSVYVAGPSEHVTVRDCVSEDPYLDDAFTCHFSRFVRFENCRAVINDGKYCWWNTNGFEIDEGSIDCTAVDCYAYRFSKGFQAKGHSNTPGDVRTTFERCTAESCGLSFAVESTDLTGRDLRILNCTSITPTFQGIHDDGEGPIGPDPGTGHWTEACGLEVKNRVGVVIENFQCIGIGTGGVAGGSLNNVVLQDGKNYVLDGLVIDGVGTTRGVMDSSRGFIQLWGDTSENFTVRNVVCKTVLTYRLARISINNPGTPIVIEDVVAVGNSATESCIDQWKAGIADIRRITQSGYVRAVGPSPNLPRGTVTGTNGVVTQPIANTTVTVVGSVFTEVEVQGGVTWDSSNYRFSTSRGGDYNVYPRVAWQNNNTGLRLIYIRVNGSVKFSYSQNGTAGNGESFSVPPIRLAPGDYIDLACYQSSGGNLNLINNAGNCGFAIARLEGEGM